MAGAFSKIRYWYKYIPTALTLGNSLCGFTAILYALQVFAVTSDGVTHTVQEVLSYSAWLICGAMIFDMLDGWTARLLNATSEYGAQMDSLADMVTFGVAPAVMVSVMAQTNALVWLPPRITWILCAVYVGCAALRLALYNVKAARGETGHGAFDGLPSPGAAAAVASLVLIYGTPEKEYNLIAQALPFYSGVLGLLMVSKIPYMHFGYWLGSRRFYKLKMLALIVFGIAFARNPIMVAAIAINLYVLSGPIGIAMRKLRRTTELPNTDEQTVHAK